MRRLLLCFALLSACSSSAGVGGGPDDLGEDEPDFSLPHDPIDLRPCGHAHNDYEHEHPLTDALDHGFCSVEADVWLLDGELRIGHDQADAMPGRTLESLYLQPLETWVAAHGGRVLEDRDDFTLLVDVKSAAAEAWTALDQAFAQHAALLTEWNGEVVTRRAVTVVISGNRVSAAVATAQPLRRAALDGRLGELSGPDGQGIYPLVSVDFDGLGLSFHGAGPIEDGDRARLAAWAAQAHSRGQHFRIYGWPVDTTDVWSVEREAGIDRINADNLAGLEALLASP